MGPSRVSPRGIGLGPFAQEEGLDGLCSASVKLCSVQPAAMSTAVASRRGELAKRSTIEPATSARTAVSGRSQLMGSARATLKKGVLAMYRGRTGC